MVDYSLFFSAFSAPPSNLPRMDKWPNGCQRETNWHNNKETIMSYVDSGVMTRNDLEKMFEDDDGSIKDVPEYSDSDEIEHDTYENEFARREDKQLSTIKKTIMNDMPFYKRRIRECNNFWDDIFDAQHGHMYNRVKSCVLFGFEFMLKQLYIDNRTKKTNRFGVTHAMNVFSSRHV